MLVDSVSVCEVYPTLVALCKHPPEFRSTCGGVKVRVEEVFRNFQGEMGVNWELEITVLSAHGLRNVKKLGFGTMDPYAVLWIDSNSKASTHVAERGGTDPTWNSVIRMLCRESLFGTAAKAMLVIAVFHKKPSSWSKLAGTADVLLSELKEDAVTLLPNCGHGSSEWSEPKRMSLEVRRLRKGSNFREKVTGSIDIQVRLAKATRNINLSGHETQVTYNGMPIPNHRTDDVQVREFCTFNADMPGPVERPICLGKVDVAAPVVVYYQHFYVKKPALTWKGIRDYVHPERFGVLAMGAFAFGL